MTELEDDPGYRFLSGSRLAGATLTRWQSAQRTVAQLWTEVSDLHAVLDSAQAIHDRRKAGDTAELNELLTGAAVTLASVDVPLAQRGMTGPATVVTKVSVAELVATMTGSYAGVAGLCAQAQAVLSAHVGRLDEFTGELDELTTSAGAIGLAESGHPLIGRLAAVTAALDEARELVFTDPLALTEPRTGQPDTGRIEGIATGLAEARHDLDALVALRAETGLDRLTGELRELADAETQARAAMRAARTKLTVAGLPDPPESAPGLADRLAALRESLAGPGWWRAGERSAELSAAVAAALRVAKQAAELAAALLDRRAELRGRLDAYQAKVGRLGLAEDAELLASHQLASGLLWTSPCDLAAATRALAAYQRLITERESNR